MNAEDEAMRRLEELAVSRLLETLSTEEAEEYVALKRRFRDFDDAAIESTIALAHLALVPEADSVPSSLRAAVHKDAQEFFGSQGTQVRRGFGERSLWARAAGWWVAAAASVLAAFALIHRGPSVPVPPIASTAAPVKPIAVTPVMPPPASAPVMVSRPPHTLSGLASERQAFLSSHPHAIQRAFRAGGDSTGERVVGDVVWDEDSQTGYMRFVNLRHNEPNAEQYQLWIFDGERDQRFPVDGGVFDVITRGGEQIVRIQPKLRVRVPLTFAVTVEPPGGVVVSDRSRIAAIANVT
jgi:anti-sigma-K factor RskA